MAYVASTEGHAECPLVVAGWIQSSRPPPYQYHNRFHVLRYLWALRHVSDEALTLSHRNPAVAAVCVAAVVCAAAAVVVMEAKAEAGAAPSSK